MVDTLTKKRRSENMAAIRSGNTTPELIVRSVLHSLGFRFRLHHSDLPGKPDVILSKHKSVVFVHGCFWHCHDCIDGHVPKSRRDYWAPKLQRTQERDRAHVRALKRLGWRVLVVWECATQARGREKLEARLLRFLSRASATPLATLRTRRAIAQGSTGDLSPRIR